MGRRLLLLAWVIGILFPMAWASRSIPAFARWFDAAFATPGAHIGMHAALYAVLMALAGFALRPGVKLRWLIALLAGVAVLHEGLQVLAAGRGFSGAELFDWGVDVCGGLVGLALARSGLRGRRTLGYTHIVKHGAGKCGED